MTQPSHPALFAAIAATWPPQSEVQRGPFLIRNGAGGGKRVSSATRTGVAGPHDLEAAERAMAEMEQTPMFQIAPEDRAFDTILANAGYDMVDPTVIYHAPVNAVADPDVPRLSAIRCEGPLAIQAEIWAEGGIGPARLAVMARVTGRKSYFIGRCGDRPAATAFAASHGSIAMVHAVETRHSFRRHGAARAIMHGAANWAVEIGAKTLAVLVVRENEPANALYASLGMTPMEGYHYRVKRQRGHN